jgi:hypothetical protein
MATKKKVVAKGKEYTGSKQNGGRKIVVEHYKDSKGHWRTTSHNAARYKYQKKHGRLSRDTDVDHKNNNHDDDRASNLHPLKHGKNTAKENKRRARKKAR